MGTSPRFVLMMRTAILLALLSTAAGQLVSIAGFPIEDLLTRNGLNWVPKRSAERSPMTHRTLYFFQTDYATEIAKDANYVANNSLTFFAGTAAAPVLSWKLEAPYLETTGELNARCDGTPQYTAPAGGPVIWTNVVENIGTPVVAVTTGKTAPVDIPLTEFYEHPPYPNQDPFALTYRKLCVRGLNPGNTWVDTTLWVSVTRACKPDAAVDNLLNCGKSFKLKPGDKDYTGETGEMKLDRLRRTTCCGYAPTEGTLGTPTYLPSKYGICINRDAKGSSKAVQECCGDKPFKPQSEKCCSKNPSVLAPIVARIQWADKPCPCQSNNIIEDCNAQGPNTFSSLDTRNRRTPRTTTNDCCIRRKYSGSLDLTGNSTNLKVLQTGLCYSKLADSKWKCCDDGNIYDPGTSQCCPLSGLQKIQDPCPCGRNLDCPSDAFACCTQQFPLVQRLNRGVTDQCNKFANWEELYGTQGNTILGQTETLAAVPNNYAAKNSEIYSDGLFNADSRNTKCFGKCYNKNFQTCCNGVTCIREYERCCNATCCNRFTSTCTQGLRRGPGADANPENNRWNALDYSVSFETCTDKENLTVQRAWLVFILPTLLLFATLASLAIVVVVARRATEEIFELTERVIVLLSSVVVLFATPFYFSPVYKYGVVLAFTGLFLIVSAVIRNRNISLTAIFIVVALLIFLVEPFNGNIYLSLTGSQTLDSTVLRPISFRDTHQYFGVLNSVIRLSPLRAVSIENRGASNGGEICTKFYDFFGVDTNVEGPHDLSRDWNPRQLTFGYCSRAWITTVLIFAAAEILLSLVLLMLTIFSFVKRLERKQQQTYAPVHLDVKRLG